MTARGAILVLPTVTAGQQGPVAAWVSTAGWASSFRRLLGEVWVVTPVGVMDPDAQRAPNWPAPAPEAPPVQIAPTIDNTSAAVRLLRSVAPWTAPTHAGNRGSNDSE